MVVSLTSPLLSFYNQLYSISTRLLGCFVTDSSPTHSLKFSFFSQKRMTRSCFSSLVFLDVFFFLLLSSSGNQEAITAEAAAAAATLPKSHYCSSLSSDGAFFFFSFRKSNFRKERRSCTSLSTARCLVQQSETAAAAAQHRRPINCKGELASGGISAVVPELRTTCELVAHANEPDRLLD